jgi:uncharacterized protein YbjT (DUF2867 family)
MTTVLVTGATGKVGSQVVGALREQGNPVRAFVRNPARAAEMSGAGIELASGDFAEPESIRVALAGVERVFLACGNVPGQVEFERNVIDAAAAAGVRRIVKLSALGAQIGAPLAFWDWHGRIEQHLERSGVPYVVLRPTNSMANLLGSAEQVRREGRFFAPAGDARIALIDPLDVAAVAAAALTTDGHDGETVTLTGPEAITHARVAEVLSAATGRPVQFVDVPDGAARQGFVGAGMPDWLADQLITLYGLLREGAHDLTTDAVRAFTGREPRPFARFARDHAALFGA